MKQFFCLLLLLLLVGPAQAAVELSRGGLPPQRVEDVYVHQGIPYLDIDEVLQLLALRGKWDSVEHRYRFSTPLGRAEFFPGGSYLVVGERFYPLTHPARFIDGRLRVPEDFITSHLPRLLDEPVYYRNLNPPQVVQEQHGGPMDRLFSFLLRKKKSTGSSGLQAIAVDPGHGGKDPGAMGLGGIKEKDINLAVARHLEKLVKMELGIPVHMSRDGDYELTPRQRLEVATRSQVDAFILLHAQASFDASRRGITLMVRPDRLLESGTASAAADSMSLARELSASLKSSGFKVAGILQAPLLPLGQGDLPSVLVELGYLSNPEDRDLLQNEQKQQLLARALFEGLKRFNRKHTEVR